MKLDTLRFKNFRRLVDVKIELDDQLSIFVGANNSGKTSVAQAMNFFIGETRGLAAFHDISACRWEDIDAVERGDEGAKLPELSLDMWFVIEDHDLHRIFDLLPGLRWEGKKVGVRISFVPGNQDEIVSRFQDRRAQANHGRDENADFEASPSTLREFLETDFHKEYEFKYHVLDIAQHDGNLDPEEGYEPQELLKEQGRTGRDIIGSLIKVDFLHAQRHLSDTAGGSRSEELSRQLSRYYQRNLELRGDDYEAIRALSDSQKLMNDHLAQVFSPTLEKLAALGYPGLKNPQLMIKTALNPAAIMNSQDGTHVHYALDDESLTLPDKYNGLGFKNLIYMVVELLDKHAQWQANEIKRPPLHLMFIEEPEAHLHAQLQQVFVKQVLSILKSEQDEEQGFNSQLVLTTHSPHILYEKGFGPIRYFKRGETGIKQFTQVLNLSEFSQKSDDPDFLERYMRLTHCDLFFADAAILVEGNVERLLMPHMIDSAASGLRSCYLSILEVGGAFAHKFKGLINFLEITTLIITDLDSVYGGEISEEDDDEDDQVKPGKTCKPEEPDAVTSNQILIDWLPKKERIDELLAAKEDEKEIRPSDPGQATVRVTYPCNREVTDGTETFERAGRTLEVAFAFDNLAWSQETDNKDLKLRVRAPENLDDLAGKIHKKVHAQGFKKTDFALALLTKGPKNWNVPHYIEEGLEWLQKEMNVEPDKDGDAEGGSK